MARKVVGCWLLVVLLKSVPTLEEMGWSTGEVAFVAFRSRREREQRCGVPLLTATRVRLASLPPPPPPSPPPPSPPLPPPSSSSSSSSSSWKVVGEEFSLSMNTWSIETFWPI